MLDIFNDVNLADFPIFEQIEQPTGNDLNDLTKTITQKPSTKWEQTGETPKGYVNNPNPKDIDYFTNGKLVECVVQHENIFCWTVGVVMGRVDGQVMVSAAKPYEPKRTTYRLNAGELFEITKLCCKICPFTASKDETDDCLTIGKSMEKN